MGRDVGRRGGWAGSRSFVGRESHDIRNIILEPAVVARVDNSSCLPLPVRERFVSSEEAHRSSSHFFCFTVQFHDSSFCAPTDNNAAAPRPRGEHVPAEMLVDGSVLVPASVGGGLTKVYSVDGLGEAMAIGKSVLKPARMAKFASVTPKPACNAASPSSLFYSSE